MLQDLQAAARFLLEYHLLIKYITYAWFGDNVVWLRGIGFHFAPQLSDVHAQVIGLVAIFRPPDFAQENAMGHYFACIRHELVQQFILGGGEIDFLLSREDLVDRKSVV